MISNKNHKTTGAIGVHFLCSLHSKKEKSHSKQLKVIWNSSYLTELFTIHILHFFFFLWSPPAQMQETALGNQLCSEAFGTACLWKSNIKLSKLPVLFSIQNALVVRTIHQGKRFLKMKSPNMINKGRKVPIWAYNTDTTYNNRVLQIYNAHFSRNY